MNSLLYYSGFTIKNENWLKFALLYFENLSPIIPPSGDIYLQSWYNRLIDSTNLITPHRPSEQEGINATLDALDYIDKILRNPSRYEQIFESSDFIDKWKNKDDQEFTIFREKYTEEWEQFCKKQNIGHSMLLKILHISI